MLCLLDNFVYIAGDVADDTVELSNCNFHRSKARLLEKQQNTDLITTTCIFDQLDNFGLLILERIDQGS
jgi:glucokinase